MTASNFQGKWILSKGGSRFGAGRPGYRVKAEHLQRVDVRDWARRGYLAGGCSFTWGWHRGGESTGSMGVDVHSPLAVTLRYSITGDGKRTDVAERLTLVRTPCPYGSARPWFICPRCPRRVAMLYLRGGYFACRHCMRVAYSSQSEDEIGRMWRVQQKIEVKLGEYWQRPKGMRQATYRRLKNRLWKAEERRERAFEALATKLLGLA